MEATLEEAQLHHPLQLDPPIAWDHHTEWDGLERFRGKLQSASALSPY
jgi:hypothetical protein